MARGQIVELAVRDKLLIGAPERALLRIVNGQVPGQNLRRADAGALLQQRQKIRLRQLLAGQLREQ